MIEDKYIELIQKEIDKNNSQEESIILKNYLAQNPEAQTIYDSYIRLSETLIQAGEIEPPHSLKNNIMSSITVNKYFRREKTTFFQTIINAFKIKINIRYAYSFATGIIAGILILTLFNNNLDGISSLENDALSGAIIYSDTVEKLKTVDKKDFAFPNVKGSIEIKSRGNIVHTIVDINSTVETELFIRFPENNLVFNGFRQHSPLSRSFHADRDFVKIIHREDNKYFLTFRSNTAKMSNIDFEIHSVGNTYKITLSTQPPKK